MPEWIWDKNHSDTKTERWFGHNVESTCAGITSEVRKTPSSFVWDVAFSGVVAKSQLLQQEFWRDYLAETEECSYA